MKFRITPVAIGTLLILLLTAESALGQALIVVKNDQLPDDMEGFSGTLGLLGAFNFQEEQLVYLTSPCDGFIVAIDILVASGNGYFGQSVEQSLGLFEFGSCDGIGGLNRSFTALQQPGIGDAILFGPVLTVSPSVATPHRFGFLDQNQTLAMRVPVTAGQKFVISFEWGEDWCTNGCTGGCTICSVYTGPFIPHDALGCTPCSNGVHGPPFGLDTCFFPSSGNVIMRAIIECAVADDACCLPDGSCAVMSPSDCTISLGEFQGPATDCAGAGCTELVGACCTLDPALCSSTTQALCNLVSGTWLGSIGNGFDCFAGDPCNLQGLGACCLTETSCWNAQTTESDCETIIGGTWKGLGTDCNANLSICTPTGACCFSTGGCLDDQTEANCLLAPGATWLGEGIVCVGDGPPDSACLPPCPADCSIVPDGQVNVTDLLALLAGWGSTGSCDMAPPGGDGTINVTDLLALLAAWGPCP